MSEVLNEETKMKKMSKMTKYGIWAFIVYPIAAIIYFIGMLIGYIPNCGVISTYVAASSLYSPFFSLFLGILGLLSKEKDNKVGLILNLIAVILPIVIIIVLVVLFATGVAFIRCM